MGLKMQIQVFGSSLWQIRPHYSPISPLQLAGRSALSFSALLVFITLWYLSPLVNPPLFPGPVRRGEQPGDQREICGCRVRQRCCLWSDSAAFLRFCALPAAHTSLFICLVGVATTFSASPYNSKRLETKEEKYRRPLGQLSLLK